MSLLYFYIVYINTNLLWKYSTLNSKDRVPTNIDYMLKSDYILDYAKSPWANSRRYWRIGKAGMLQSMGSQSVGHDLAMKQKKIVPKWSKYYFSHFPDKASVGKFSDIFKIIQQVSDKWGPWLCQLSDGCFFWNAEVAYESHSSNLPLIFLLLCVSWGNHFFFHFRN